LLVLGLLLPNHYPPWTSFHSEVLAFAALFAWLAATALTPSQPTVRSRAPWAVLAVLLVVCVQRMTGLLPFNGDVLLAAIYLGGIAGAIHTGLRLAPTKEGAERALTGFAIALAAASMASVVLALFQWLRMQEHLGIFINNMGEGHRPFANFGQPNLFGTLVVMGLVSTAWLYERGQLERAGGLVLALFLATGIALAQSRSAYLGAAAVFGWWLWIRRFHGSRISLAAGVATGAYLLVSSAAMPWLSMQLELVGARDTALFDNNGRLILWKQVVSGIIAAPWTGYGWGQTAEAQMTGSLTHAGRLTASYAHNLPLDIAAWFGVPLALVLIVTGTWWILRRLALARSAPACYALGIGLPFAIHSMFEFPFAYAFFLFPVAVLAGLARGLEAQAVRGKALGARWLASAAIAWILLAGWIAWEYLEVEEDFRIVRFESMRVGRTPDAYVPPDLLVNDQMRAMLRVARLQPRAGMSDEAISEVRDVSLRFAWAPLSLRYAMVLQANGREAEFQAQMNLIRAFYGEIYWRSAAELLAELRNAAEPSGVK
jgi:O-antigen ligase